MNFYGACLEEAIRRGLLNRTHRVLVVGDGETDRQTLSAAGFTDVMITNLAPHAGQEEYVPYAWKREDAENLSFGDGSFDWVVDHAALHHMGSPHRAFLEMLRVARKGVVAFESRDSLLMRLAERLGFTGRYALEPIFLSSGKGHGVRNQPIPNFITRWTEGEVRKTVYSMHPAHEHRFEFFYDLRIPVERFRMARSLPLRLIGKVLDGLSPLIRAVFRRQGNCFGFLVQKNVRLQPWMKEAPDGSLLPDIDFLAQKYDRTRYRRGR